MKLPRIIWIAIAVLFLWLLLGWLLGGWMGLHAPALYYLRGGLSIIGIIGFVGFLLLRPKTGASGEQPGVSAGELDDNFNEAAERIQATGVKQMAALPAVFFIGETDTAKTTIIAKSDIAQLLAGQAQQEVSIVPTRAVNYWIAKNTLFVDPAGGVLADGDNRKRLFKKFSSVALKSVMGSRQMPARSVVLTIDCQAFLQKGGADAIAVKARQFQGVLAELAQEIGSSFPVYVLFTKADKLSYFRDFVENLTDQEAADVLGITLPFEEQHGVYHQHQTSRLNNAFQQLYYSLADRRAAYLSREHKAVALPNIYEFPREFNKLRSLLTSFLVDVCRPSQLGISPFLRGFYFTGIRAVTVNDVAPASLQVPSDDSGMDSGATRMFTPRDRSVPLAAEVRDTSARRVPQWVYLPHFLPGVILADNTATSVGNANVKLNVARRVLLGSAIAAALLMGIWWTVSYTNNRGLVHGAFEAAQGASAAPPFDALQRLTKVKETLETLNSFEEHGRPLSYGGFLYSGDDARDSVRKTYYGLFRRLLLGPTQDRLVQVCTNPSDVKPQLYFYNALKSYLITTQYHAKSVPEFLTPTLLLHWTKEQPVEPTVERLARENFDFYSRELLKQNDDLPQTTPDAAAVGNCRDYLNRLGQTDPIYRRMLKDAAASGKKIIFNDDYPGTESTVVNRYEVDPEFTKAGFTAFQELLKRPEKYFSGEDWVLGPKSAEILDKNKVLLELQRLYQNDFTKKWQAYLQATTVRHPATIQDAVVKLDQLSGARSALLLVLCVASENTSVPSKEISDIFQPVQVVTPPGCLQGGVSGAAAPYMTKLVNLHETLKSLEPGKLDTYSAAIHAATDTDSTVKELAFTFKGQTDDVVTKMLKAPIYYVAQPESPEVADLNNAAAGMCQAISPLLQKYPFNPGASQDASMAELDDFLRKPDGSFWKQLVHSPAMTPFVSEFGDSFRAKSTTGKQARPQFIAFLNKVSGMAHVLYGPNSQVAGFKFTMMPVPSAEVVEHVTLTINGQIQSTDARGTPTKEFEWPGKMDGVDLKVRFAGGSEFNIAQTAGLWGLWRFMDSGTEIKPNEFEWKILSNREPMKTPQGIPVVVHLMIDPSKAPVLRPHFFNLSCVGRAI